MKHFFSVLIVLAAFPLSAQMTYYRADKSGAVYNQIGASRFEEFDYVITVEDLDNAVIRQLFEKQKEIRRWERTYDNRRMYPGRYQETEFTGARKLLTSYFNNYRLQKEEIYFENRISEVREYQYSGSSLSATVVKTPDEKVIYTTTYTRGSNGRLLRATNTYENGEMTYSVYGFLDFDLRNQIHTYSGYSFQYNYFKGKLVSSEEWIGTDLVYRKIEQDENRQAIEEDFSNNKKIIRDFDEENRVIREVTYIGSAKIVIDYTYDKDNRVTEKYISSDARRERVTYEYDKEGNVTDSLVYVNDVLTRELIYEDSAQDYTEIVYREGKPFIRVVFRDNIEVENELLFDKPEETAAAETETVAAETETVAAETETVAAETETVAAETETVAAETEKPSKRRKRR